MESIIKKVLQLLKEACEDSVFVTSSEESIRKLRSAIADITADLATDTHMTTDAKTIRNLLSIALCDIKAYTTLQSSLVNNNLQTLFVVDDLATQMSSEYMIEKSATQVVIGGIAEFLGYYSATFDKGEHLDKNFEIEGDVLKKYLGKSSSVIIPDTIRVIGEHCFKGYSFIKQVKIASSVEYIGKPKSKLDMNNNGAFEGCKGLKSIFFAENSKLKSIERYAFYGCTKLQNVIGFPKIDTVEFKSFGKCSLDEISTSIIRNNTTYLSEYWNKTF